MDVTVILGIATAAGSFKPIHEAGSMSQALFPAVALVLGALAGGGSAAAEPIVGRASIIDADTIEIRGTRIRLYGIDAPESAQTCKNASGEIYRCGQAAANALAMHVGEASVSCDPVEMDRYGRTVAVCEKGGEDLNAWLVEQGHAVAYRKYSTVYVAEETEARKATRGIWAGAFTEPAEWRREHRSPSRP